MTHDYAILDGGMGRLLESLGAPFRLPEWSALALIEAPDFVQRAHQAYVEAGADVITTNSYGLVPYMIGEQRFRGQGRDLASEAGRIARAVADGAPRRFRVAGSLPPLFGSYRPEAFRAGRSTAILAELVAGLAPHVDLWLIETQSSTPAAGDPAAPPTVRLFRQALAVNGSSAALRNGRRFALCCNLRRSRKKAGEWRLRSSEVSN